jgi:hypothetical protein
LPAYGLAIADLHLRVRGGFSECDLAAYNRPQILITEDAMPLSGEAIRLMNYIDDVAVTLRRVLAFIPTLTPEERARVHEHLKHSKPNADDIAKALYE